MGHFECKFQSSECQTEGGVAHQPVLVPENYTVSQKSSHL